MSSFYNSVSKIIIICYTVPEIRCVTDVIVSHFWLFFALLPLTAWKMKIKKKKKQPGDIIILHKCTKNYDQMMYDSWDMVRDRCNCCFSFWAIFCTFKPKISKFLKKWKKYQEILSFYKCVPKIVIRWCTVPEIWCMIDVIIFHFGLFFALLFP